MHLPWQATSVPHCCRKKYKKTKRRREGGSRDILMSSLVPINSLTTHARCSAEACGKVTQTKGALLKMKWPVQPIELPHRQEEAVWFHGLLYGWRCYMCVKSCTKEADSSSYFSIFLNYSDGTSSCLQKKLSKGVNNWCSLCVASSPFICVLSSGPRGEGVEGVGWGFSGVNCFLLQGEAASFLQNISNTKAIQSASLRQRKSVGFLVVKSYTYVLLRWINSNVEVTLKSTSDIEGPVCRRDGRALSVIFIFLISWQKKQGYFKHQAAWLDHSSAWSGIPCLVSFSSLLWVYLSSLLSPEVRSCERKSHKSSVHSMAISKQHADQISCQSSTICHYWSRTFLCSFSWRWSNGNHRTWSLGNSCQIL